MSDQSQPMDIRTFIKSFFPRKLLKICFGLILFISCSDPSKDHQDHLVFRYNEIGNIATLDPAFARNLQMVSATNQLFNGLVQLDDSLNVVADIAKNWTFNDSTLTYTFNLRSDVYFHKNQAFKNNDSTRKVIASDFVYSFDRLKDPKIASPGSWVLQHVSQYRAENDTTFTIQLKEAFPAFPGLLSMKYCSVVPREAVEFYGNDFRKNPVGTGPFQFKMWEENIKLVLRKNPLYYEKDDDGNPLPYLEAVAITFLPDKQSEFMLFAQERLDFISGLDNSYKDEILTPDGQLQKKYQDRFYIITGPYLNTEYLGFNLRNHSPDGPHRILRQAINYGFDRQKMILYLRNGMGIPANQGFIPKGLPGFGNNTGYDYQPEKAKELVNQYKMETGISRPEVTIATNSQYLDLCEFIQRELEKIGISVVIDVMPPATLQQKRGSGDIDIFRGSWIADYPDAQNYLSLFYSPNFSPNGPNYTHFQNQAYDSIYRRSFGYPEMDKRAAVYQKLDSIIISQAPVVPLFYDVAVRFVNKNVDGLGINPQNVLSLKKVRKNRFSSK